MANINVVLIGKLVEAFHEQDAKKFFAYANLIADNLDKDGNTRGAVIIRKRINNEYKDDAQVVLDNS